MGGETYVSPDESFLIMTYLDEDGAEATEDIYIVRKEGTGWGKKVKLNGIVNTNANEHAYWVSPDGKYLFFGRHNDIYIANLEKAQE